MEQDNSYTPHGARVEAPNPRPGQAAPPEPPIENQRPSRLPSLSKRSSGTSKPSIPRKPVPTSTAARSSPIIRPMTNATREDGLLKVWWWEIGACFLAMAALMAIIATLYSYRGRPLPRLPFGISVNALISIYVVIMKAALLTVIATGIGQLKWTWFQSDRALEDLVAFDQASRGVIGSLYLIWHVHFRQAVASLGAILAVLMLAMDPFTQQLIHYVGCSEVVTNQLAEVPRTNFFQESGYHIAAYSKSINTGVQSSVNSGIFAPGSPVDVTCPTGNCTFAKEYGTVGFCSYCTDVSHLIDFKTTCYNTTEGEIEYMACSKGTNLARNMTSSLPNGVSMTFADEAGGYPDVAAMELVGYDGGDIPSGTQILVGKSELSGFKVVPSTGEALTGCDNAASNDTWRCRNYGAAVCALGSCVRTYVGSVTAGAFKEEQVAHSPYDLNWGIDAEYYRHAGTGTQALVDLECIDGGEHSRLVAAGYQMQHGQRWLPYNITFDPRQSLPNDSRFPQSMLVHHCLYMMDDLFMASLWSNYLVDFFHGTIQGVFSGGSGGYTGGLTTVAGPQILQTMYNFGNISFERIDSIFKNISDSMTNYMRQNGNANHSAPMQGQVLHYATCLQMEWAWIAFPASIVVLTLVFCLLTIVTTAVQKSAIWKSSPLAMVYHGPYATSGGDSAVVEHDASEKGGALAGLPRSIRSMEAAAGALIVRLDKQDGRVRISENQVKKVTNSKG